MIRPSAVFFGLALACAGAWAQTSLTVVPQQVGLVAPAGSTVPVIQTLVVSSAPPNLDYTADIRYLTPVPGWLSATPLSGKTPSTLTLSATAANLPAGTYLAQVTVAAGALGTVANVIFSVGANRGAIAASPTGLTFYNQPGAPAVLTQNIALARSDGSAAALSYTASASSAGNWLSVSPFPATAPGSLAVLASAAGLPDGTYTGTVTITPAVGAPTVVPVTLATVGTETAAPDIELTQTKVSFNYRLVAPPDGPLPPPPLQTVEVTGADASSFTASSADPWIELSSTQSPVPSSTATGTVPGAFAVGIDPTGLAAGVYAGTITVKVPGLPDSQLAVEATVGPNAGLNANPSSVVLNDVNRASSVVTITASGAADLAFTAAVQPGATWLHVTPSAGSTATSASITISADPTGLATGVYHGTVVVTPPGTAAAATIPVELEVTGPGTGPGALVPSADSLSFDAIAGMPIPAQTVSVDSVAQGIAHPFTAAASSDTGWLSAEPFQATAPATVTVRVNSAAFPGAGVYNGQVILTSLTDGAVTTIPVTVSVAAKGIAADQTSLQFTGPDVGVAPPPQTLTITANTASSFTISGPSWVKVSPSAAPTPAVVTVAIDPTGLPIGTTTGVLRVAGPDNVLTIPVSVTMPPPASLTATPVSVSFSYTLGDSTLAPASVSLGTTNGKPLAFTAKATTDDGGSWLLVSPGTGTAPGAISVSIDPSALAAGAHTGSISVSSANGDTQAIAVSVTVNGSPSVQMILHSAILAPTPIAPGMVIAITGANLGPPAGVSGGGNATGKLDTALGGTRVLFDGIAAPLLFAGLNQVNAIVPYAMYGRATAQIEVQTAGGTSRGIDAKVVDSAPGIFTAGSSGTGQASALNADMSVNSTSNPAARGSIVTVFGSGEGQTDPPGQDGRIIGSDLRRPLLPVSATVGGQPAEVTYLGSAPTQASGVFQANIRIPLDAPTGLVAIRVQVGSAMSQSEVVIAIQ